MPSNSETGHAVNVANYKTLIEKCAVLVSWNPANTALTIANLNTQQAAFKTEIRFIMKNSHFIQILNFEIEENNLPAADRAFYKLDVKSGKLPEWERMKSFSRWPKTL